MASANKGANGRWFIVSVLLAFGGCQRRGEPLKAKRQSAVYRMLTFATVSRPFVRGAPIYDASVKSHMVFRRLWTRLCGAPMDSVLARNSSGKNYGLSV